MQNIQTPLQISRPNRRRFRISMRSLWQLRYRIYALIVILILAPILYSNDADIPETVSISGLGYSITQENLLAGRVERVQDMPAFGDEIAQNIPDKQEPETILISGEKVTFIDKNGRLITELLKNRAGLDLGFVYSQPFVDLGSPIQIGASEVKEFEENISNIPPVDNKQKSLDDLIPPTSGSSQFRNLLVYDKYKIRVPIIYTALTDLFGTKPDGSIDFTQTADTSDVNSPIQRKLQDGVVHLAYSPMPGEIGNSYIVGHSSNYSYIKSAYNTVFKPIEQKSQPGEEFVIYDRYGRALTFKVFEAVKIAEDDVAKAYEKFDGRRVVTLQTSILGIRNGKWAATHRWLTRGELVL